MLVLLAGIIGTTDRCSVTNTTWDSVGITAWDSVRSNYLFVLVLVFIFFFLL